jgi:hypothetical protein
MCLVQPSARGALTLLLSSPGLRRDRFHSWALDHRDHLAAKRWRTSGAVFLCQPRASGFAQIKEFVQKITKFTKGKTLSRISP